MNIVTRWRDGLCVVCALLILVLSAASTRAGGDAATDVVGHWEGAVVRLNSVQTVAIDITRGPDGFSGTYDIPDLNLYGEALTDIRYEAPALEFHFLYGLFTAHCHADALEITGTNAKWGPPLAIHLKRTPKPLARLSRRDVRFSNGQTTLAGTLFLPLGAGPHPAVVLVHGSGKVGRSSWEYRGLGNMFAAHGFAALVYDKRGVGESTGVLADATFDDLANDAVAAVTFLTSCPDVDRRRIGLMGTSQGGWLAPLAASRSRDVAFLILDKAAAVSVQDQELDRVEYTMRSEKYSADDIAAALDYTRAVFRAAYTGEGRDDLAKRTELVRGAKWIEVVQLVESDADLRGWRLERYDPEAVLRRTRVPVLALYGERDTLVPPDENISKMREYLAAANNPDVTVVVLPGEGHNRYRGAGLEGGRWDWPDGFWVWDRVSPRYEEAIFDWVTRRAGDRANVAEGLENRPKPIK